MLIILIRLQINDNIFDVKFLVKINLFKFVYLCTGLQLFLLGLNCEMPLFIVKLIGFWAILN